MSDDFLDKIPIVHALRMPQLFSGIDSAKRKLADELRTYARDPVEGLSRALSFAKENISPEDVAMGFGTGGIGAIKAYHGSPNIFNKFKGNGRGELGRGDYLTPDRDLARQYATSEGTGNPTVYEVNIRHPDPLKEAADPFGIHHLQQLGSAGTNVHPIQQEVTSPIGAVAPHWGDNTQYLIRDPAYLEILRKYSVPFPD